MQLVWIQRENKAESFSNCGILKPECFRLHGENSMQSGKNFRPVLDSSSMSAKCLIHLIQMVLCTHQEDSGSRYYKDLSNPNAIIDIHTGCIWGEMPSLQAMFAEIPKHCRLWNPTWYAQFFESRMRSLADSYVVVYTPWKNGCSSKCLKKMPWEVWIKAGWCPKRFRPRHSTTQQNFSF